jgi:hypothetical protein
MKLPFEIEMRLKIFLNSIDPGFVCEEPGCWKREAMQCRLVVENEQTGKFEDQFDFYCVEHASKNGYCWGCGEFWSGCESFDFSLNGLCSNCKDDPDLVGYEDDYDDGHLDYFAEGMP